MLTQKEKALMKDLKTAEQVCRETYARHAAAAKDPQLKKLFSEQAQTEAHHFDLLCQIENGEVPFVDMGQLMKPKSFTAAYGAADSPDKAADAYLCNDLLAAEKGASALYNTCVFEFTDQGARDVLNYIQRAEQDHGKRIWDYMTANSMTA